MTTFILAMMLARQPKVTVLPAATIGKMYSARVADGLTGCYGHSEPPAPRDAIFTLPPGLSLARDGTISGTPKKADDYQFEVVCKDFKGRFSISVNE